MSDKTKLLLLIAFNIFLLLLEIAGGIISGSLALLSDAGHMLADTTALLVSYAAIFISSKLPTRQRTFGYKRVEVLAALFNASILGVLSVVIFYEAFTRFLKPFEIKSLPMLVISSVGLTGNIAGFFLLRGFGAGAIGHAHHSHDNVRSSPPLSKSPSVKNINIKGAYYHIIGDMLSSFAVVAGAIVIRFTNFYIIDSILGMIIAIVIIRNAFALLKESLDILMESTPSDIDIADLSLTVVRAVEGVKDFHDVHVWSISTDKRALSAHVELKENIAVSEAQNKILCDIRKLLSQKYNIYHTTFEVECGGCYYNADGSPHPGSCYL